MKNLYIITYLIDIIHIQIKYRCKKTNKKNTEIKTNRKTL